MQSCAQTPYPWDAWCHPRVPPDPSWEQAGAISSGELALDPGSSEAESTTSPVIC